MISAQGTKNYAEMTSKTSQPDAKCPCMRPKTRLICSYCGFIGEGRIRRPCTKHTNVTFINDYSQCPMCKVHDYLTEF